MAMLQDDVLVCAMLDFPGDTSAPREGGIDGETNSVAEERTA
jgi:hypothetical protein